MYIKRSIQFIFALLVLLLAGFGISLLIRFMSHSYISFTPYHQVEKASALDNPDRGFYEIVGYMLNDHSEPGVYPYSTRDRLILVEINLLEYANSPLSDIALEQLDYILSTWSQTNKHIILRFLYDWNGQAQLTEPESIDTILMHMEQTSSVYNKYADTIFTLQGIFVGNVGEMNNTHYMHEENMKVLIEKLASVTNPAIYLSVRTPNHWRSITQAESYLELPANSLYRNMGLFNDGLLGSDSDLGTYSTRSRSSELAFQNELCSYVPNGGEVVIDNPWNDLYSAIDAFKAQHITYLNRIYDLNVMKKWENTTYNGEETLFQGMNGYEYMEKHLGYRLVLEDAEYADGILTVPVRNVGFAPNYRPFDFTLWLENPDWEQPLKALPLESIHQLPAGETTMLRFQLPTKNLSEGAYKLHLSTIDRYTEVPILYGNYARKSDLGYYLGRLDIAY